ncbi:hypothetical protein GCM10023172_28860 [Hymenobacter ginsengisoli]|uniref:DUF4394 domain-containing protein n=1 Tax=Hymenobacter ginsengisoli TaxID=1051626 RepID=A0ABP8QI65_9BACT|nr:DUF4394 domain-containing protein [Hymenobacter sp. KCTC 23674]MBO2029859.1 DUF4394 domain-containing protein [Hymenobacter sp. BT559]
MLLVSSLASKPLLAQTIYGLEVSYGNKNVSLFSFKAANPGTILTQRPITGVAPGQVLVGIDFRPATGELYALGYAADIQEAQLYTINLATAAATPVSASSFVLALGAGTTALDAARIGFDFDPVADQVRITSSVTQASLRLSPASGNVVAADAGLAYAPNDPYAGTKPGVGTVAYTNSYAGSRSTQLYAVDESVNQLLQLEPGTGALRTVGAIGSFSYAYNPNKDLDFYYDPTTSTNAGYLSFSGNDPSGGFATLYRVDVATGRPSLIDWIGPTGGRYEVYDIAVVPAAVTLATHPAELATSLTLFPNPAVGTVRLRFELPHTAHVQLTVRDAFGRTTDTLDAGLLAPGTEGLTWQRRQLASGVYFFQLSFDGQPAGTRRVLLIE